LLKVLNKLLPKEWKSYSLETGSVITWYNPIPWYTTNPWKISDPWTVTYANDFTAKEPIRSVYNVECSINYIMKPYGREKKIKGLLWKRDYHIHQNNRKIDNWWVEMNTIISRTTMKQNMKKILILLFLAAFTANLSAQVNFCHLLGDITTSDVKAANQLKTDKGIITSVSYFARLAITETGFEVPLFKGGGGQWFKGTGIGVSISGYGPDAVKKFTTHAILFVNNATGKFSSAGLAVGVPIPKLSLPDLNAGLRYDWGVKSIFLQTTVSVEF
jgi:hypothetical protein